MVELKRKRGESFEAFLRRFNRKLIRSGKILQARKIRYKRRPLSKTKLKASAVHRKKVREQKEYLKKIGKLVEEKRWSRRR